MDQSNDDSARKPRKRIPWKNSYPRLVRVQRKERVRRIREVGIRSARKQWMICVETTAIVIPEWAKLKAEKRLGYSATHVWFRGRNNGRAKILERQDRQAGGHPRTHPIEYRVCQQCKRLLLGLSAELRRTLDESGRLGRSLPCQTGDCVDFDPS